MEPTCCPRWQAYGGIIVQNSQLQNTAGYSKVIEQTLEIDKSHQRASQLKRLFGTEFEFEPRRRSDIDMIFLASSSEKARQIKPTLNFYYAANIPVYATSKIYSSSNSKNENSDLDNIRLTTSPWVLNKVEEKAMIITSMDIPPDYELLYALGVDTFLLYPRLTQLYQFSNQKLNGATGQLSIDNKKRISRKQLWAKIHRGKLKALGALTLSSEDAL
jgi:hypothetical protein